MEDNPALQKNAESDSGIHTLFSVSGRNQLELIAIADNKANMITAICVALIFLNIGLFSSGFSLEGSPILDRVEFVLPMGILLAFCSVSAICSILALKPKIVRSKNQKKSVLFFHNFYRMTLDDYKAKMRELMKSKDNIYEHMITNMYYNGLVLERKYALLGLSYSIFLSAIVLSITAYVIATVI